MKRLLKISLDLSLLSFIPVLSWFLLSLILDKNLINIFTLTYPLQFIWYALKSIFSTGANISKEKDKNRDAVMSGIVIGSIVGLIIYGLIAINIESYIKFMNMDVSTYKNFAIYSVLQLYIQLIFQFILGKLYYEEKNSTANRYSIEFNLLNFITLIGSSLLIKNAIMIIAITLISITLYVILIAIKSFEKFKLKLDILKCIKYDSAELSNSILFFFIYLFGLSTALEFGEKYTLALTFVSLITDTQWDTFDAIATTTQIDISKNKFNYIEHIKNAYKLLIILLATIFIMFAILFKFYTLNIYITMIYLSFDILNFFIYPIYRIKTCYLQLEDSAVKITTNKILSNILRMLISLLKTPYCTSLGQIASGIYELISINMMFKKDYIINEDGSVKNKEKQECIKI